MQNDLLEMLIHILGKKYVVFEGVEKEELAKTLIPEFCTKNLQPSVYVFPESAEQVKAIVQIAKEFTISIWPCSRGNNWGYGTMTTTSSGGILMNLKRMNKIHHVDNDLAFAVIEPGVSYQQLNEYLKQNNYDLIIDCNDSSPNCSVIGNALERGIGLTPYADHFANLCGLSVVLPSGELVETGGGPVGGHKNFHCYKWGTGPYLEGIFSQGNFGIVVQAGIWLMPKPKAHCSFILEVSDDENYFKSIDVIRRLILDDVIKSRIHLVNDFANLTLVDQYPYVELAGKHYLDDQALERVRKTYKISKWSVFGGLYGTPDQIRVSQKIVRKHLKKFGRLKFIGSREVAILDYLLKAKDRPGIAGKLSKILIQIASGKTIRLAEVFKHSFHLLTGNPTEYFVRHAYLKSSKKTPDSNIQPAHDGCGCLWLAPLVPNTSKHVELITEKIKLLFHKHGFDFYVAQLICPRSSIYLLSIFYKKEDANETQRAIRLYEEAWQLTLALGYQQYRTSTHFQHQILKCNEPWLKFLNDLKSGADPCNVIAPGKYGISTKNEKHVWMSLARP